MYYLSWHNSLQSFSGNSFTAEDRTREVRKREEVDGYIALGRGCHRWVENRGELHFLRVVLPPPTQPLGPLFCLFLCLLFPTYLFLCSYTHHFQRFLITVVCQSAWWGGIKGWKWIMTSLKSEGGGALPWWSSGSDSTLPMKGAWVWSLVRELDPICCNSEFTCCS